MIREFGKPQENNTSAITVTPLAPEISAAAEEKMRNQDSAGLRPFHVSSIAVDEDSGNSAMIAGGVVAALLIVGGGIYAYETMTHAPQKQQIALATPAVNHPAAGQTAAVPPAPPAATPETAASAQAPAPGTLSPAAPARSHQVIKATENDNAAPASVADEAVNAPMTLTPDTAPLPQDSTPANQTATQQPITAPDVSGQPGQTAAQSAPAMANNAAPQFNLPSGEPAEQQPTPPAQ